MEKFQSHLKFDQIHKKRKADETASVTPNVAKSSSSSSDLDKVNSVGENAGSALKPMLEPQNLLVEGEESHIDSRMSMELSKVSRTAEQPLDGDQRRSESRREKRRRKSGHCQATQGQTQEVLFHNQSSV